MFCKGRKWGQMEPRKLPGVKDAKNIASDLFRIGAKVLDFFETPESGLRQGKWKWKLWGLDRGSGMALKSDFQITCRARSLELWFKLKLSNYQPNQRVGKVKSTLNSHNNLCGVHCFNSFEASWKHENWGQQRFNTGITGLNTLIHQTA